MNKITIIKALLITVMCSSVINCVKEKATPSRALTQKQVRSKEYLKLNTVNLKPTNKLVKLRELAKKENIILSTPLFRNLLTDEKEQETDEAGLKIILKQQEKIVDNASDTEDSDYDQVFRGKRSKYNKRRHPKKKMQEQKKDVKCDYCNYESVGNHKNRDQYYLEHVHIPQFHYICPMCGINYKEQKNLITIPKMKELSEEKIAQMHALACAAAHTRAKKVSEPDCPYSGCSWAPQKNFQNEHQVPKVFLGIYHLLHRHQVCPDCNNVYEKYQDAIDCYHAYLSGSKSLMKTADKLTEQL